MADHRPKDNISLEEARRIKNTFKLIALSSVVYIGIGVLAMMKLEKLGFLDSLYFSVVSLTTVGYGDITPETSLGKIFVMIYLIVGIGIIAALANNIIKNVLASRVIKDAIKKKK